MKIVSELERDSSDWMSLKYLKKAYPVEIVNYAISKNIHQELAFDWWVLYIMRKQDRIVSKLSSKYWEQSLKYGIEIPKKLKRYG